MTIWWKKHLDLLVTSGLHKKDIQSIIDSRLIEIRDGVKYFLRFLSENNIPLVIISAN
jgi:2-hydroxy-3-keto-5-methylthiopentenyl-1-phosphate phosphatase